jgi:hypothetical protein
MHNERCESEKINGKSAIIFAIFAAFLQILKKYHKKSHLLA